MLIDLQILTEPGIYIAFVAVIIEIIIVLLISRQYYKARHRLISPQDLQNQLQKSITNVSGSIQDNLMIFELIDLMGSQRSTETIRNVLRKHLSAYNERIRHLANMGPAIGLFFTFIGMFLTILKISTIKFEPNIDILNQNFSNLFPVFLGGASGIAVYTYGMILLSRIQTAQNTIEEDLLKTFLVFESTNEPPEPKTVEDAYKRLLKPIKQLLNRLNLLSANFEELSSKTKDLIESFSEKTNDFIEKLNGKVYELNHAFKSNLDALEISSKNIAKLDSIFIETAKYWEGSAANLSKFSQNIVQTEDRLKNLVTISETISKLIENINSNAKSINQLVNWVEQDRLEFKNLINEIRKFVDSVLSLTNNVEQFKLGLTPIKEVLECNLSEIKATLENMKLSPGLNKNFQSDVTNYLEKISISLDKISKDGQLTKDPTLSKSISTPKRQIITKRIIQKIKGFFLNII